MAYQMLPGQLN